jgi:hypothetical protein
VDVRGRSTARGHERLHDEVGASGLLPGHQERVSVPRAPKGWPSSRGSIYDL